MKKIIATALFIGILGAAMPVPEPTRAAKDCPPPTSEGVYFKRSIDEKGNAVCGFSFYNACPYEEAISADNPACKAPEEPKPIKLPVVVRDPVEPTVTACGGK